MHPDFEYPGHLKFACKNTSQKGKKRNNFSKTLLCLIQLNFCNSIKIEKQLPEVFCKKRFGKFDVLCFLETPVLRLALLPYYDGLSKSFFQKTFI